MLDSQICLTLCTRMLCVDHKSKILEPMSHGCVTNVWTHHHYHFKLFKLVRIRI